MNQSIIRILVLTFVFCAVIDAGYQIYSAYQRHTRSEVVRDCLKFTMHKTHGSLAKNQLVAFCECATESDDLASLSSKSKIDPFSVRDMTVQCYEKASGLPREEEI